MILKIIIFALLALLIYKFLGGKLPSIGRKDPEQKKIDEDTLVECETCNTFVTLKESIIINGKYYCSQECANKK
ncbi:PP0621 family protein [Sulfurovum sp. zt1-1]|uniref:PP0621 family protein n=1 Tax=Sulfurovum zhangzhouensis TaxID=3019067 RepID=A0ABT7QWY2_9BACT|nr:PP0621 family protein [Sulfurovum zhangzhouensis]MDM5271353.1 PP0621 family protein [Sulfurovum zhangzhouensis]